MNQAVKQVYSAGYATSLDIDLQTTRQLPKNMTAPVPANERTFRARPRQPATHSSVPLEGDSTMGMFNDLMTKIFRHAAPAERPHDAHVPGPGTPAAGTSAAAATRVDVDTILTRLASENKEKLDWKHSIVDLMKLIDMDSSLDARKDLAADLKYTGDTTNSASMNMWLHREVMRKLAANGGNIPADLLAR